MALMYLWNNEELFRVSLKLQQMVLFDIWFIKTIICGCEYILNIQYKNKAVLTKIEIYDHWVWL